MPATTDSTIAPPPAPRELWSHEFLDALALEHFREIARRIRRDPQLIEIARSNIRRWTESGVYDPPEERSLREWEPLLDASRLEPLLALMTSEEPDATRMRQSSPLAGILSREDREAILERVTEEWSS